MRWKKNRLKRTEQEAASSLWLVVLFASTYTRTFAIKRLLSSHATFVYCFHNHRRSLCETLLWRCLAEGALCTFSSVHSTWAAREGVRRSTFACNCCHFSLFKHFFSLIFMRSYRYCCICAFCSSRTNLTQTPSTNDKPQAFFTEEHSTMILFHFAAIFLPLPQLSLKRRF